MRLLYEMMTSGKILPTPAEPGALAPIAEPDPEADETWKPVEVLPGPGFDGPWYKLNVVGVPGDLEPNDERLWANFVVYQETGEWPANAAGTTQGA